MKTKTRIILLLAAFTIPLSWAGAAVSLEFNNSINNQVGGSPVTITGITGGTITLSLQLFSTSEVTNAVDYWLTQFSGPGAGVFSITGIDYTGSMYPDPSAGTGGFDPGDNFNNSTGAPGADGTMDNRLFPRNGPDLGSTKTVTTSNNPAGTNQIAIFTLSILPGAAQGLYQIRSFDYTGFGWSSTTTADQPFAAQAAINVNVVPEPATWSLIALGGLASVGLNVLRRRKS